MTLTPAYGRDYKSKAAALQDWNDGKDFMLNTPTGSGYINRPQADEHEFTEFQIRWKKLTMVAVIKNVDGTWK